jgi:nucleoside 2-deoxyribosyltransferase
MAGRVVKPPVRRENAYTEVSVFLAGSIEMGKAVDWQYALGESLTYFHEVGNIYNPRRDDWDSSWEQRKDNPQFNEQVTWELDHIEDADIVFFNFIPDTQSPITLLELGFALGQMKEVIVCCPPGFWRKGNIDILCDRESVTVYDDYTQAIAALYKRIHGIYEEMKQ